MPAGPNAALPEAPGAGGGAVTSWMTLVIRAVVVVNVVCAIALLGWIVWIWVGLPLREPPPGRAVCISNVKNITLALQMYVADNDEVFPPAVEWCDTLREYIRNDDVYRCPKAWELTCGFAYNVSLDALPLDAVAKPAATIAIFESDQGWNTSGGAELLPKEPRHLGGDNYGFADGHAAWVNRQMVGRDETGMRIWSGDPARPLQWDVE